jgi:hypothetical protein
MAMMVVVVFIKVAVALACPVHVDAVFNLVPVGDRGFLRFKAGDRFKLTPLNSFSGVSLFVEYDIDVIKRISK